MGLVVAGFGSLIDEVLQGQCAAEENTEASDRVRERDCGIVKLKDVDRNRDIARHHSCCPELCW